MTSRGEDGRSKTNPIEAQVEAYYTEKLRRHGATPIGVDWSSAQTQQLRFDQLAKIWHGHSDFTICDFGCGYGALADYLRTTATPFAQYLGVDLSADMTAAGEQTFGGDPRVRFMAGDRPDAVSDFLIASGVFNVKQDTSIGDWEAYVDTLLKQFIADSRQGFAINALTCFADEDRKRADLWYADPGWMLKRLVDPHRRRVRVLHDYPLFEFTVLVWHL